MPVSLFDPISACFGTCCVFRLVKVGLIQGLLCLLSRLLPTRLSLQNGLNYYFSPSQMFLTFLCPRPERGTMTASLQGLTGSSNYEANAVTESKYSCVNMLLRIISVGFIYSLQPMKENSVANADFHLYWHQLD